jgi:hypothetical protein
MHGSRIGTGRFALPLGIKQGIEPSRSMAEIAKGIRLYIVAGTVIRFVFSSRLPTGHSSFPRPEEMEIVTGDEASNTLTG